MHQVGFTEPRRAVYEERIERYADVLGDGERGCVGESVAFANYETFKSVSRIYRRGNRGNGRFGGGYAARGM